MSGRDASFTIGGGTGTPTGKTSVSGTSEGDVRTPLLPKGHRGVEEEDSSGSSGEKVPQIVRDVAALFSDSPDPREAFGARRRSRSSSRDLDSRGTSNNLNNFQTTLGVMQQGADAATVAAPAAVHAGTGMNPSDLTRVVGEATGGDAGDAQTRGHTAISIGTEHNSDDTAAYVPGAVAGSSAPASQGPQRSLETQNLFDSEASLLPSPPSDSPISFAAWIKRYEKYKNELDIPISTPIWGVGTFLAAFYTFTQKNGMSDGLLFTLGKQSVPSNHLFWFAPFSSLFCCFLMYFGIYPVNYFWGSGGLQTAVHILYGLWVSAAAFLAFKFQCLLRISCCANAHRLHRTGSVNKLNVTAESHEQKQFVKQYSVYQLSRWDIVVMLLFAASTVSSAISVAMRANSANTSSSAFAFESYSAWNTAVGIIAGFQGVLMNLYAMARVFRWYYFNKEYSLVLMGTLAAGINNPESMSFTKTLWEQYRVQGKAIFEKKRWRQKVALSLKWTIGDLEGSTERTSKAHYFLLASVVFVGVAYFFLNDTSVLQMMDEFKMTDDVGRKILRVLCDFGGILVNMGLFLRNGYRTIQDFRANKQRIAEYKPTHPGAGCSGKISSAICDNLSALFKFEEVKKGDTIEKRPIFGGKLFLFSVLVFVNTLPLTISAWQRGSEKMGLVDFVSSPDFSFSALTGVQIFYFTVNILDGVNLMVNRFFLTTGARNRKIIPDELKVKLESVFCCRRGYQPLSS